MAINNVGNISGPAGPNRPDRPDDQRIERSAAQETQPQQQPEIPGRDSFQAQDAAKVRELAAQAAAEEPDPREEAMEQARARAREGFYNTPEVREGVARQVLGGGLTG